MSWRGWLILIVIGVGGGWFYFTRNHQSLQIIPSLNTGNMKLTSSAFVNNTTIPVQYTCTGQGVTPPLTFSGVPAKAQSLALIMDDPDAPSGTFVHWVIFNMPPSTAGLEENGSVPGVQTGNSENLAGYTPPCPPSGQHRYYFKLYALNETLVASDIQNKADLELAMSGRIIARSELIGLVAHQ